MLAAAAASKWSVLPSSAMMVASALPNIAAQRAAQPSAEALGWPLAPTGYAMRMQSPLFGGCSDSTLNAIVKREAPRTLWPARALIEATRVG